MPLNPRPIAAEHRKTGHAQDVRPLPQITIENSFMPVECNEYVEANRRYVTEPLPTWGSKNAATVRTRMTGRIAPLEIYS